MRMLCKKAKSKNKLKNLMNRKFLLAHIFLMKDAAEPDLSCDFRT